MKNKKFLFYNIFFIIFFFSQIISGMELVPAILCSIEAERNDEGIIEKIIEPSEEEKQKALELSDCITGENSIIYTSKKDDQMYHYIFSINDISKLFPDNNTKVVQYCYINDQQNKDQNNQQNNQQQNIENEAQIKEKDKNNINDNKDKNSNNKNKKIVARLTTNDNDKKCFEEINNKQQNIHRRNRVKLIDTELSKKNDTHSLKFETPITEEIIQVDLSLESSNALAQLIAAVNLNPKDFNETKNILFTFKQNPDQPVKIMSLPIDNNIKNWFPALQNVQQPVQQNDQQQNIDQNNQQDNQQKNIENKAQIKENEAQIKKLIDSASKHLISPQLYNNPQKQLNKVILQQIKILNPNYINNLNFYTVKNTTENNDLSPQSTEYATESPDLIAQLNKNKEISNFFRNINIYVHPDKHNGNNVKQTVWSNTLLELNNNLHQQNKRFEENKEFIKFTFLSHALPYATYEVGTLAKTLIFAISNEKQKNEITQLKNKIQNLQQKTKNDLLKIKNNLLKAKNKVNKYLQKPLTPDEFHRLGQSLERYSWT